MHSNKFNIGDLVGIQGVFIKSGSYNKIVVFIKAVKIYPSGAPVYEVQWFANKTDYIYEVSDFFYGRNLRLISEIKQ